MHLLACADGMGGHQAGEVASLLAISRLKEYIGGSIDDGSIYRSPSGVVRSAFTEANLAISQSSCSVPGHFGMGTTLTACVIVGSRLCVGHVGDTRAYILVGRRLKAVTSDHSLVGELVRNGDLSEDEAMRHPQRNVLTRALGTSPALDVDVSELDLLEPYVLALLSDGVTSCVKAIEIGEILAGATDGQAMADKLVDLALERGGYDDATCVVAVAAKGPEGGGAAW